MLHRYLLKEFLKYLFGAIVLFSGVGMIVEVTESLKYINNYEVESSVISQYYLYRLPLIILIVTAPSFLFAICYVISVMIQNKEFIVICSSGRSQKQVLMPIVIFSFFFTGLFFCFNQFIAYPSNLKAYEKSNNMKGLSLKFHSWRDVHNFHTKFGNYYFFIDHFLPKKKKIIGLHISVVDEDQFLQRVIEAEEADIFPGKWLLKKAMIISFEKGVFRNLKRYNQKKEMIPTDSSFFQRFYLHEEVMNVFQLDEFIELKKEKAHHTAMYISEYYWHFSFPFICFFFVLIGAVIALKIPSGNLAASLAVAILCGTAYFLLMFYGKSLGKAEIIHPFIAGSFANFIAGGTALYSWFRYVD